MSHRRGGDTGVPGRGERRPRDTENQGAASRCGAEDHVRRSAGSRWLWGGAGGVKATSAACLSRRCAGLAGAEAKEKGGRARRSAREGPHTRRRAGGNRGSRCFSSFLFVPLLIQCVCVCNSLSFCPLVKLVSVASLYSMLSQRGPHYC